jgi:hypothetical protein
MNALEPARFDDGAWPLLIVHMPSLMNNVTAIHSLIEGFEAVYRRNERFASILDGSAVVKFPGALERKVLLDWVGKESRVETERRLTVATGLVLTSGPMRAFVSALNWVTRPASPQKVTATQEEAVEWCCGRLEEAGIALSPGLGALRTQGRAAPSSRRSPLFR